MLWTPLNWKRKLKYQTELVKRWCVSYDPLSKSSSASARIKHIKPIRTRITRDIGLYDHSKLCRGDLYGKVYFILALSCDFYVFIFLNPAGIFRLKTGLLCITCWVIERSKNIKILLLEVKKSVNCIPTYNKIKTNCKVYHKLFKTKLGT